MQEGFAAYDELIIEPYLDAVELEIGVLGNSKDEELILSLKLSKFLRTKMSAFMLTGISILGQIARKLSYLPG